MATFNNMTGLKPFQISVGSQEIDKTPKVSVTAAESRTAPPDKVVEKRRTEPVCIPIVVVGDDEHPPI